MDRSLCIILLTCNMFRIASGLENISAMADCIIMGLSMAAAPGMPGIIIPAPPNGFAEFIGLMLILLALFVVVDGVVVKDR